MDWSSIHVTEVKSVRKAAIRLNHKNPTETLSPLHKVYVSLRVASHKLTSLEDSYEFLVHKVDFRTLSVRLFPTKDYLTSKVLKQQGS